MCERNKICKINKKEAVSILIFVTSQKTDFSSWWHKYLYHSLQAITITSPQHMVKNISTYFIHQSNHDETYITGLDLSSVTAWFHCPFDTLALSMWYPTMMYKLQCMLHQQNIPVVWTVLYLSYLLHKVYKVHSESTAMITTSIPP